MSHESTVSMLVVRGLLHSAREAGIGVDSLFNVVKLEAAEIERVDARMPNAKFFELIDLVAELSQDPAIGLTWVERQMERSFGPVAHMLVYARTLRDAFALLSQFETLIYDGPSVWSLIEHGETVTVRQVGWIPPTARARAFASESMLTGILKLVRVYFADARPLRTYFAHTAPSYTLEYTRTFGTAVEFAQPWNEITFQRALLDQTSPHADPDMYAAQRRIAEQRLSQTTQEAPYKVRVREFLLQRFPNRLNMASVARAMEVSVRGLRNQLATEGTTYRAVEHEALGTWARDLLQDPKRTVQETAFIMGFSDAATFHRALKRWTGLTPSAIRRSRK